MRPKSKLRLCSSVSEKGTGRLLGAQMMCERATDMISFFTQALCAGLTVSDL
ncbi:MAG: hypothetical protein II576_12185, partial [Prevotella sp.]|nr:hypothetical protein [Prevotella sp.]